MNTEEATPQYDAVGQILHDAANLIRERGWCQGWFGNAEGQVCILGAIQYYTPVISPKGGKFLRKGPEAALAIDEVESFLGQRPADWNDAQGRTKEDVIAALEATAERRRLLGKLNKGPPDAFLF